MKKEHFESAGDKAAGKVKEEVGEATDDKSLEAEGRLQQLKGKAKKVVADVKDALD
ncbi:MAG: CsbD family protein [Hyphomonadaceae bacterium]|nr:CsbD family protein [Hyphomonadaceae bacterium]